MQTITNIFNNTNYFDHFEETLFYNDEQEHKIKLILLKLNDNEKRFGFSIIGGCDECLAPEIEDIVAGSSADKSDLQIGDEILEINGQSVDSFDHAQIIAHIHNCIRERKITLKVKRSTKTNELCINENIKEAFIIGVDEQAKERLNKLTKAKQVTPIDLEDLSNQLDQTEHIERKQQSPVKDKPTQTVTLHKEYFLPDKMVKQQQQQQQNKIDKTTSSTSSLLQIKNKIIHSYNSTNNTKRQAPIVPSQLTPNPSPNPEQQQQQQQSKTNSLIRHSKKTNDNGLLSASSGSSSSSSSSTSSTTSSSKSVKSTANKNDIELSVITNTRIQNAYTPPITPSTLTSPASSSISSPALQPTSYVSDDDGQVHREMPIDCPDNFIAEVKSKPKYPPVITTQTTFITFKTPKQQTEIGEVKTTTTTTKNLNNSMRYIDDTNSENKFQAITPNTNATRKLIDKQKQNQQDDELRKLKDDEEIILRNSLRNSEKLRNLESRRRDNHNSRDVDTNDIKIKINNGRINNGYVNDDDDANIDNSDIDHIGMSSSPDDDDDDDDDSDVDNNNTKRGRNNRVDSLDEYGEQETNKYKLEIVSSPSPTSNEKPKNFNKKSTYTMDTIDSGNGNELKFDDGKLIKTLDISDLFSQVDYIQTKLQQTSNKSLNDNIILLRKLYQTSEFQNALILYNKLVNLNTIKRMKPICDNSYNLADEIMKLIETAKSMSSSKLSHDANELCLLLSKLNVKTIFQTHDKIACEFYTKNEDVLLTSSQLNDESSLLLTKAEYYCVENLKLVNIDKAEAPLGATIRNLDGRIVIGRIVKGGAADLSGLLHEEDEILEINSVPVRGKTINDVSEMLSTIQGTVSFLIIPQIENGVTKHVEKKLSDIIHIRSLFNYEPDEDLYIPCKELGLRFLKGDILHIISQDDEDWWQAYKDGEKDQNLAGLIPSQSFQERRLSQMQALIGDSFMDRGKHKKNALCIRGVSKNKRRRMFEGLTGSSLDEIVTYEEVVLFKPPVNRKRPIVLIGPHSIGRHELRKRLMQSNPSLYEVAVPHTTRTPRRDEIDGKDYHFIARHIFEADIKQNRFIEHGEFEKNLYGTSRDAIKKVIDNSKICVLNLYPQALKTLRNSDLMPYVIYIGPPSLAKLKELKTASNESFKENDLLDIIDKGREIEELYGHYFDKIIRNTDMDKTYQELVETIDKVENEENWVPAVWLKK